jgi:hypothetical protein
MAPPDLASGDDDGVGEQSGLGVGRGEGVTTPVGVWLGFGLGVWLGFGLGEVLGEALGVHEGLGDEPDCTTVSASGSVHC